MAASHQFVELGLLQSANFNHTVRRRRKRCFDHCGRNRPGESPVGLRPSRRLASSPINHIFTLTSRRQRIVAMVKQVIRALGGRIMPADLINCGEHSEAAVIPKLHGSIQKIRQMFEQWVSRESGCSCPLSLASLAITFGAF